MTAVEARAAYDARAWQHAFDLYAAEAVLGPEDLDRFAESAHLLGRMAEYYAIRERTYLQQLEAGDLLGAARAALWLGIQKIVEGEVGIGGAWMARAGRLVEQDGTDSIPAAFLTMGSAFEFAGAGDLAAAAAVSAEAAEAGRRHGNAELTALALHQEGQFLLEAGRHDEGLARLDEAMLVLSSGELSAMVEGIVFCGTITGCWNVYDLRRAQEWTAAMSAWCDAQPEMANFTGECKVHRAELKQLRGEWDAAREELEGVDDRADFASAAAAACMIGNLARLTGDLDLAEESFAEAARLGCDPQPGLALLRVEQGSVQAAAAMSRRCLAETQDQARRVELLAAAVEISLAAAAPEAARSACDELAELSALRRLPILEALSSHASAAVLLPDDPASALREARVALRHWIGMRAPYHEARARVLMSQACDALGDRETAERERATARAAFEELGAIPDLRRMAEQRDLLSRRELEVLRLLATGATNRSIAETLVLSERTVDRHVSNIFAKLGVSTRAAATAYAFEKQLV